MKKLFIVKVLALVLGLILFLPSCKKENVAPPTVKVFEGAITVYYTSADVSAEVTDPGGAKVMSCGFVYGLSGGSLDTIYCGSGNSVFSATLNNLQPNSNYVYEAFARNAGGIGTSGKVTFTTHDYLLPTVETHELTDITTNSAICSGKVTNDGGGIVSERGICWGTSHNPIAIGSHAMAGEGLGEFFCEMNNLASGTTYYVRAYATNAKGTAYGSEVEFTTEQGQVEYTVSLSANPTAGGTVTGDGTYEEGATCTVNATASSGYTFVKWTENGNEVSTNANYTFIVNANRSLQAHFTANAPNQYTINVSASPLEGGTVSGGGSFNSGTSQTVTATANEGYTFTNWTENSNQVSDSTSYTFTLTSNRTLVANFTANAPNQYTISISANPAEGGAVSGGGTYLQGQSCMVRAAAAGGYTFQKWTENGNQVSTDANYTFTVTGNRSLVAHFIAQAPDSYSISAAVTPIGAGTVVGAGTYQQGQSCTLRATPATGYTFAKWTKNGTQVSTNATYTFTVTESASYVAHFELQTYTINASANPSAGGTIAGGGTYNYGQNCTLTAIAASGYSFVKWTKNGSQVSTNASYTFAVTASASYVAHFQANSYTISVSANPSAGGMVNGGGTYTYGQSCTVHASTNNGYTFSNWTVNGSQVSTSANYTFTVTGNRTLVANFTSNTQHYTINVSANPSNGGSVSGGGTYLQGQSCTVHAIANTNYSFANWSENGTQVSTNANYTFTVTSNRNLVANFTEQPSLNVPQNLQTYNTHIFENSQSVDLSWDPVRDRSFIQYRIYKNGTFYTSTTNSFATIPYNEFQYNMNNGHGEIFTVTALYSEGESQMSNAVEIWVSGFGQVSGTAIDLSGYPLQGVTIVIMGQNEFNDSMVFTFTTNENGFYQGSICAGVYNSVVASFPTCPDVNTTHQLPLNIIYNQLTSQVDFVIPWNGSK